MTGFLLAPITGKIWSSMNSTFFARGYSSYSLILQYSSANLPINSKNSIKRSLVSYARLMPALSFVILLMPKHLTIVLEGTLKSVIAA